MICSKVHWPSANREKIECKKKKRYERKLDERYWGIEGGEYYKGRESDGFNYYS